jgi:hypothetical protein
VKLTRTGINAAHDGAPYALDLQPLPPIRDPREEPQATDRDYYAVNRPLKDAAANERV